VGSRAAALAIAEYGTQQARTGMPLVISIGNLLLRDDGVGVHALRALAADPPPGCRTGGGRHGIFSAQAAVERRPR